MTNKKTKSAAELIDEFMESMKADKDLVVASGGRILIRKRLDGNFNSPFDVYEIWWDEIPTPGDALRWIQQLSDKRWVTLEHVIQFADVVITRFGI